MNFPISRSYLEHNERSHMLYSRRWTSLPGWFLSGDLLITRCRLLISGEIVRYISLPLNYCKSTSCQQIGGLQSQIYRCSKHARRYLDIYLSGNKLALVYECMQMVMCMWQCVQKVQQTTTNGMYALTLHAKISCRPHMNTFQKTFSFSILAYNVMQ